MPEQEEGIPEEAKNFRTYYINIMERTIYSERFAKAQDLIRISSWIELGELRQPERY